MKRNTNYEYTELDEVLWRRNWQYKNAPFMERFLTEFQKIHDEFRQAIEYINYTRLLEQATGELLTQHGNNLGVSRYLDDLYLDDETYRIFIKVAQIRHKSNGSLNDIAKCLSLIYKTTAIKLTQVQPLEIRVRISAPQIIAWQILDKYDIIPRCTGVTLNYAFTNAPTNVWQLDISQLGIDNPTG